MYDSILLPVDEAATETGLLHHASELAHWADAEVTLLYVADTSRDSVTVADGQVVDALVEQGDDVVAEAGRVLDSLGVDYDTDVVQGTPAETIVDYAERYDYDLVAMPTHGREGLARYLLGSVTEKVVRLSPVPVLTTGADEDGLAFPYEALLLPTDGSEAAMRAVEHGLDLAAALSAEVHALSVVDDSPLAGAERALVDEAAEEVAREAVDDVVEAAEGRGIDVTTHVVDGAPDEELLVTAEAEGVDAVVMGATGRRGVDRVLLGSVAEKTVRSADVPVITVSDD